MQTQTDNLRLNEASYSGKIDALMFLNSPDASRTLGRLDKEYIRSRILSTMDVQDSPLKSSAARFLDRMRLPKVADYVENIYQAWQQKPETREVIIGWSIMGTGLIPTSICAAPLAGSPIIGAVVSLSVGLPSATYHLLKSVHEDGKEIRILEGTSNKARNVSGPDL